LTSVNMLDEKARQRSALAGVGSSERPAPEKDAALQTASRANKTEEKVSHRFGLLARAGVRCSTISLFV
jgi:hypothetical protein